VWVRGGCQDDDGDEEEEEVARRVVEVVAAPVEPAEKVKTTSVFSLFFRVCGAEVVAKPWGCEEEEGVCDWLGVREGKVCVGGDKATKGCSLYCAGESEGGRPQAQMKRARHKLLGLFIHHFAHGTVEGCSVPWAVSNTVQHKQRAPTHGRESSQGAREAVTACTHTSHTWIRTARYVTSC
jgi:hypothetical protein